MRELTMQEMQSVEGSGFLSGFTCGLALTGAFVLMVSPEPFSKVALITYVGTATRCVSAF